MNQNRLLRTIEKHEGFREKPYRCTAGKLTIGIGWNIQEVPMRYSEARFRLRNDLDECRWDLAKIFQSFDSYPDHVQEVLMNMRFQLGPGKFRSFENFIAAIRAWDIDRAKTEMLDSKWAKQDTPGRANELAGVLTDGFKAENHPG